MTVTNYTTVNSPNEWVKTQIPRVKKIKKKTYTPNGKLCTILIFLSEMYSVRNCKQPYVR